MSEEKDKKELTVKKDEDFSTWYNQLVLNAELADYTAVKGFMFIRPYGYAMWEKIQAILDKRFKECGHKNAYAPALIPERLLNKEKSHVEGFAPEVFRVTKSGSRKLAEELIVRPTSETIIYDSYAKWIRSWRDLPVLLNYWNSVFRAEITMTRLFLRTCEFLWQEGHTVHATKEEADEEVEKILDIYIDLVENYLAIPVISGRKTEKEKFAGALYTRTIEALMPDGKALQSATSHNLGQNFSKAFDITFLDKESKQQYAWQTSWGISTRLIGALVMTHGDDKGLILPPKIAPIQIVIIPILFKDSKKKVVEKAEKLYQELKKDFSVELDAREEYSPGWKFHEWELKGVPLRIEIGPKEIEQEQLIIIRRDINKKEIIKNKAVKTTIEKTLDDMQQSLFEKAKKCMKDHIKKTDNYKELKGLLEKKNMIKANWCSNVKCEEKIKEETGASFRLMPVPQEKANGKCIYCQKEGKEIVYIAKAY